MGVDQVNKRIANQYAILRELHFNGPLQRGELSTRHGIRKSSVTSIVAELLKAKLIVEDPPGHARSRLSLNPLGHQAHVASMTHHALHYGRVFLDGSVEHTESEPMSGSESPEQLFDQLAEGFKRMAASAQHPILGYGLSMPGFIDPGTGTCIAAVNLESWHNVPVSEGLSRRLGHEVFVDNDVRCQLWACTWFDRLAAASENLIYLHIDEGISCAIMANGERVIGDQCTAGEIGGIRVGDEGRESPGGRTDCLEAYCTLPAVLTDISKAHPHLEMKSAADIIAAAKADPAVMQIVDAMVLTLTRPLAGMVAAIDPNYLLLGTRDPAFSELLIPLLDTHLYNELMPLQPRRAEIRVAGPVESSSLRGIAGLVVDRAFRTRLLAG